MALSVLLSIDTLKTCVVLGALTRSRHNSNRELFGQGIANLASFAVGGMPGAGTMVRLARQIGYANPMKMLLTGDPVDAREAKQIGLISEVVPAADLVDRAGQLADIVAANAPLAMQAIKATVHSSHTLDWADAFALEAQQAGAVMRSRDAREGPRAFKEKRSPDFTGE